jgi:hypothetical protein
MKKQDFFEYFKEYLVGEHKDELHKFIGHYETLKQNADQFKNFIEDCENHYLEIRYEEDKLNGYSEGSFEFHLYERPLNEDYGWETHLDYYYKMTLLFDERYWGYCKCTPDMEGYNETHECCGIGCDWSAPSIQLDKIENVGYVSFDGYQRDMWELEKNWDTYLKIHEDKQKQERIKYIDEQIARLEEEKQRLLSE